MSSQVSVVMPVKNGERYIAQALESVLSQSPKPFEVLVVDGASTDRTVEVVRRFGDSVQLLVEPGVGSCLGMNVGVKAARGAYLSFLDADDLWTPGRRALQLEALQSDESLDGCFGYIESFVSPDIENNAQTQRFCPEGAQPCQLAGALLIRRAAFDRVGLFDTAYLYTQFLDWWARAQRIGLRTRMLKETVLKRRIHDANVSIVLRDDTRREYLRLAATNARTHFLSARPTPE